MVTFTPEELNELRAEGGEQAVKEHYENETKNVFGYNYQTDPKTGAPIEQGIGSPAQPSANSVAAYERFCRDQPNFAATLAKMKSDLAAFEAKRRSR